MDQRRLLSVAATLLAFCSVCATRASATVFSTAGTFAADNSSYDFTFTNNTTGVLNASTSSFASGGFVPVLTLFNDITGAEIDNNGSGTSDAFLTDILGPGTYDLFLTEFPNVAVGNLSDGFLLNQFSDAGTFTGDNCGVTGGMFYNSITCTPTTSNYALAVNTNAPTPEPSTWLLVLPPAALLFAYRRRLGV